MGGVLLGVAALSVVGATGLAVAALARIHSVSELLLAAYVAGFAEIVVLALVLSSFDGMSREGFGIGIAVVFVAAAGAWAVAGRPRPARPAPVGAALARSPMLLVLASVVALGFAYLLVLFLATAPNSWDSLAYHLSRAAFWVQTDHVGYIPNAYDGRLNGNPPNAEIALAFLLDVTRNERFASAVQYVSALACALGVFVLARRLAFTRAEAAFGALVFLTLPVVMLQAPTTQNDLVAGSMLTAGAAFVTGTTTPALGFVALTTALALGTKVPTVFGLPLLVVLAITASGGRRLRGARLLALALGTAVGAYWYVVNFHSSGQLFGPAAGTGEDVGGTGFLRPPTAVLLTGLGLVSDSFDLSGARGADILLYLVAAAAVAVVVLVATRESEHRVRNAAFAGILAALPLALYPGSYLAWRTFAKAHQAFSGSTWFAIGPWFPAQSGENLSWFGPLGLFLVVGVGIVAIVLVRRRKLPMAALLYVVAPVVWLVLVAMTLVYNPWHGRLFVFPVALSAALWGIASRVRPVAWAVVSVAAATTILSLVNNDAKPSGLRLFEPDPPRSVWTMSRSETQAIQRPNVRETLRFVEENVPRDARIALALGYNEYGYPPFGPGLSRTVLLAAPGSDGADVLDAGWILASGDSRSAIDRSCWRRVLDDHDRWAVFERRAGACGS